MTEPRMKVQKKRWVWLIPLMGVVVFICAFLVSIDQQLIAAAIYIPAYWAVCAVSPEAALFLMFGAALFPYDLSGGLPVKLALGEINLVLATPFILLRAKEIKLPPLLITILLYFCVCIVSIILNQIDKETLVSMTQMAVYLILAMIVLANYSNKPAALLPGFYGVVASGTFLGLVGIITRESYMLGMNKNAAGASLSFAAIVCSQLWFASSGKQRKWLTLAFCIICAGLLFSLSRGAWGGAMIGICFILAYHGRIKLLVQTLIILGPILAVCYFLMPEDNRKYAFDVGTDSYNVQARFISIDTAKAYFDANPIFGSGVGLRKQYDATNVVWSTLAETGVMGLVAFALIHIQFFGMIWKRRKLFGPASPHFSILAISGGLILCQFTHGCVDHYWARTLLTIWGSAAMAQGICMRTTLRPRRRVHVPFYGEGTISRQRSFEL